MRTRRVVVILVILAAAGAAAWWLLPWGRGPSFRAGALADYLPADAAAVVDLHLAALRSDAAQRQPLGRAVLAALVREETGLPFDAFGADAALDVDAVRLVFAVGD